MYTSCFYENNISIIIPDEYKAGTGQLTQVIISFTHTVWYVPFLEGVMEGRTDVDPPLPAPSSIRGGGELRSSSPGSSSLGSPWITARPRRSRSANAFALNIIALQIMLDTPMHHGLIEESTSR